MQNKIKSTENIFSILPTSLEEKNKGGKIKHFSEGEKIHI